MADKFNACGQLSLTAYCISYQSTVTLIGGLHFNNSEVDVEPSRLFMTGGSTALDPKKAAKERKTVRKH